VIIPTRHCTNLSAAVYTVLYDRHAKRARAGLEPPNRLAEARGDFRDACGAEAGSNWAEADTMMDEVGVTWG